MAQFESKDNRSYVLPEASDAKGILVAFFQFVLDKKDSINAHGFPLLNTSRAAVIIGFHIASSQDKVISL